MNHDDYTDEYLRGVLSEVKTIAVVGASANEARPSYQVMHYLAARHYELWPINPGYAGRKILGRSVSSSLRELTQTQRIVPDMVDIFRNSEAAAGVVDEVLSLDQLPKVIWMQVGVRHDEAAKRAQVNGIKVIMDRCPKIEIARLAMK